MNGGKFEIMGAIAQAIIGVLGTIAVIVGLLVFYARRGEVWAIVILSVGFTLVVGLIFVSMIVGFMFANQKQDERAMANQMRMMHANMAENAQLMAQTQQAMLLAQRQQTESARQHKIEAGIPLADDGASGQSFLIPSDELYKNLQEQRK